MSVMHNAENQLQLRAYVGGIRFWEKSNLSLDKAVDLRFAATKTTAATTTTIRMLTIVTFHDKTSNNSSSLNLGHRLAG